MLIGQTKIQITFNICDIKDVGYVCQEYSGNVGQVWWRICDKLLCNAVNMNDNDDMEILNEIKQKTQMNLKTNRLSSLMK